jgi:hypothetical protein
MFFFFAAYGFNDRVVNDSLAQNENLQENENDSQEKKMCLHIKMSLMFAELH